MGSLTNTSSWLASALGESVAPVVFLGLAYLIGGVTGIAILTALPITGGLDAYRELRALPPAPVLCTFLGVVIPIALMLPGLLLRFAFLRRNLGLLGSIGVGTAAWMLVMLVYSGPHLRPSLVATSFAALTFSLVHNGFSRPSLRDDFRALAETWNTAQRSAAACPASSGQTRANIAGQLPNAAENPQDSAVNHSGCNRGRHHSEKGEVTTGDRSESPSSTNSSPATAGRKMSSRLKKYWLCTGGKTTGPYTMKEVLEVATPGDHVNHGASWRLIGDHPDFSNATDGGTHSYIDEGENLLSRESFDPLIDRLHSNLLSLVAVEDDVGSCGLKPFDFGEAARRVSAIRVELERVEDELLQHRNASESALQETALEFTAATYESAMAFESICRRLDEKANGQQYSWSKYNSDMSAFQRIVARRTEIGADLNRLVRSSW